MRSVHAHLIGISLLVASFGNARASVFAAPGGPIPDNQPASPLTIQFDVVDSGPVSHVDLTLQGLSHTWAGDLIATLEAPNGASADLMRRPEDASGFGAFGDSSNFLGDYRFIDTGADLALGLTAGGPAFTLPSGDYQASTRAGTSTPNMFVSLDAAFSGINPLGTWTLKISDNAGGDAGSVAGAILNIQIIPTPATGCTAALAAIALSRRRFRRVEGGLP